MGFFSRIFGRRGPGRGSPVIWTQTPDQQQQTQTGGDQSQLSPGQQQAEDAGEQAGEDAAAAFEASDSGGGDSGGGDSGGGNGGGGGGD